jgi:hypothetical protein
MRYDIYFLLYYYYKKHTVYRWDILYYTVYIIYTKFLILKKKKKILTHTQSREGDTTHTLPTELEFSNSMTNIYFVLCY